MYTEKTFPEIFNIKYKHHIHWLKCDECNHHYWKLINKAIYSHICCYICDCRNITIRNTGNYVNIYQYLYTYYEINPTRTIKI